MKLTDAEKAMLDGREGKGKQKAMDLLVRYGEALGAERLVETHNVAGTVQVGHGPMRQMAETRGFDAMFSEFNLDSAEVVETPPAAVYTCQLIQGIDTENLEIAHARPQGVELAQLQQESERYFGGRGVQMMATCTPYQVGNVPVFGEHCAWMESSAVVYCNSVLGARTNTEGRESASAASVTGRIPCFGYHLAEHRHGTHRVVVEQAIDDMMDWGLLGYHVGGIVQEGIPVLDGLSSQPTLIKLKHFGAAAASSGGVEMYHVPGITPEAPTAEVAFGPARSPETLRYGPAERRAAYEVLNSSAQDRDVDFIMLGCPHNSIEQVLRVARLLDGKRLSPNTQMWVFTPRALRDVSDKSGYTETIRRAGGHVLSDTCPAISRVMPPGTRVVATDSAKQAHYLPALTGVQTWFGTVEDCVSAGLTGRWDGALR